MFLQVFWDWKKVDDAMKLECAKVFKRKASEINRARYLQELGEKQRQILLSFAVRLITLPNNSNAFHLTRVDGGRVGPTSSSTTVSRFLYTRTSS